MRTPLKIYVVEKLSQERQRNDGTAKATTNQLTFTTSAWPIRTCGVMTPVRLQRRCIAKKESVGRRGCLSSVRRATVNEHEGHSARFGRVDEMAWRATLSAHTVERRRCATEAIAALADRYSRYSYRRTTIKLREASWTAGKHRVERIGPREGLLRNRTRGAACGSTMACACGRSRAAQNQWRQPD